MCWCSSILGKNKPRYFKFMEGKQLTFKTESHPKLLLRDDLPKRINDISETNKVVQSLTQRYQPTLKHEMFTKIGKLFLFKSRGYQLWGKPRQNVQPYPSYQQRQPKYRSNKSTVMPNHCPWFPNSGKWTCA